MNEDTPGIDPALLRDARGPGLGLAGELWAFLWSTKKWWLVPVLLALLLLGALAAVSTSVYAPFLYTLF